MKPTLFTILVIGAVLTAYAIGQDTRPEPLKDAEFKSLVIRHGEREIARIDDSGLTLTDGGGRKALAFALATRKLEIFDATGENAAVTVDVDPVGVSIFVKSPKGSGMVVQVHDRLMLLRGQKAGGEVETLLPKK